MIQLHRQKPREIDAQEPIHVSPGQSLMKEILIFAVRLHGLNRVANGFFCLLRQPQAVNRLFQFQLPEGIANNQIPYDLPLPVTITAIYNGLHILPANDFPDNLILLLHAVILGLILRCFQPELESFRDKGQPFQLPSCFPRIFPHVPKLEQMAKGIGDNMLLPFKIALLPGKSLPAGQCLHHRPGKAGLLCYDNAQSIILPSVKHILIIAITKIISTRIIILSNSIIKR